MAYRSGILFVVEELLPLVISRPPTVAASIPAGDDPRIDPGSKGDAVGHRALLFLPSKALSRPLSPRTLVHSNRRHRNDRGPKKDTRVRRCGRFRTSGRNRRRPARSDATGSPSELDGRPIDPRSEPTPRLLTEALRPRTRGGRCRRTSLDQRTLWASRRRRVRLQRPCSFRAWRHIPSSPRARAVGRRQSLLFASTPIISERRPRNRRRAPNRPARRSVPAGRHRRANRRHPPHAPPRQAMAPPARRLRH
jgi:hypothetical protein